MTLEVNVEKRERGFGMMLRRKKSIMIETSGGEFISTDPHVE